MTRDSVVHALQERVKELTALHETARLMLHGFGPTRAQLTAVAALLPPAMQYPEITTASVSHGDEVYATRGHEASPWTLRATFDTADGTHGAVEVAYHASRPSAAIGPFLQEELALLQSIADMIGAALDRRSTERRLADLADRLQLAFAAAGMGLWEWRIAEDRVYWSEGLGAMVGVGAHSGRFGEYRELVHPDDRDYLFGRLDRAAQGADDLKHLAFRFRRAEGGWRHMMASARIEHGSSGEVERVLAALIDVSERRLLEEGLRQAQKLDTLGQVAAGVAHDFNNVLATLQIGLSSLRHVFPTEHENHDVVEDLQAALDRGMGLAKQLLTFSRKAAFKPAAIDLSARIRVLEPVLRRMLRSAELVLELDATLGMIWADPVQIEQVVLNLVVNARDAIEEHGHITVRTRAAPGRGVMIEVQDDGRGIDDDVRARLFEPFFTTKSVGHGTGLGLAVVASVAQQWQGAVEVDTAPGAGATFRVIFPVLGE